MIFLAKLCKDLKYEFDSTHNELLEKEKKLDQLSSENIQKQINENRIGFMEKFKTMVWDLHPKIMNLFRQNPVLIELEETLDAVKEFFSAEAKKNFKDDVEEISVLNKNGGFGRVYDLGHFAYVCSRMDYYKELERRMEDATIKINKATARAKILVNQLTDYKLNKEFLLYVFFLNLNN